MGWVADFEISLSRLASCQPPARSPTTETILIYLVVDYAINVDRIERKEHLRTVILMSGFLTRKSSCAKYSKLVSLMVARQEILNAH